MDQFSTNSQVKINSIVTNKVLQEQIDYYENYKTQLCKFFNADPPIFDNRKHRNPKSTASGSKFTIDRIHDEVIRINHHIISLKSQILIAA